MKIILEQYEEVDLDKVKVGDYLINSNNELMRVVKIRAGYTIMNVEEGKGVYANYSDLKELLIHFNIVKGIKEIISISIL